MKKLNFLSVAGTHKQMGIQQGREFAADIKKTFKRVLSFEGIKLVKPFFIPGPLFAYLVKKEITSKWLSNIKVISPHQYERLLGIAEGANTPSEELLSIQALEVMADDVSLVMGGCFSAALSPSRTVSGEPVLIKNFDFITDFSEDNIARLSSPDGNRYASFELTYKQITGSHDGMNEKGLAITYNYGLTTEKTQTRLPITLLVQEMLENSSNIEEALTIIKNFRFPNAAIITLADTSGKAVSVEITPEHIDIRQMPSDGILVNTNYFQIEEMKKYDIPHDTCYSAKKAPAGIRGLRIHETNELRYERALEILNSRRKHSEDDLIKLLSDHHLPHGKTDAFPRSSDTTGSENTICRHGGFFRTQVSALFYPRKRRVLVAFGFPCKAEFAEYIF